MVSFLQKKKRQFMLLMILIFLPCDNCISEAKEKKKEDVKDIDRINENYLKFEGY